MKTIRLAKVNGVGVKTDACGNKYVPRKVIERNVLDMLEGNEEYMNLDFCEAQIITEEASVDELLRIYEYEMTAEEFEKVYNRIFS